MDNTTNNKCLDWVSPASGLVNKDEGTARYRIESTGQVLSKVYIAHFGFVPVKSGNFSLDCCRCELNSGIC